MDAPVFVFYLFIYFAITSTYSIILISSVQHGDSPLRYSVTKERWLLEEQAQSWGTVVIFARFMGGCISAKLAVVQPLVAFILGGWGPLLKEFLLCASVGSNFPKCVPDISPPLASKQTGRTSPTSSQHFPEIFIEHLLDESLCSVLGL